MVPGAARWLPYGLLGLVAGMPVDRGARRRPLLMTTDLGRGLLLTAVPMLALTRRLTVAALMVLMVVPGLMSLLNDAAYQSFLPRLVPANLIAPGTCPPRPERRRDPDVRAGSRPKVWSPVLGAPRAVLVDAVSYLVSGLLRRLGVAEPQPAPSSVHGIRGEAHEGLLWVSST